MLKPTAISTPVALNAPVSLHPHRRWFAAVLVFLVCGAAGAETAYITDQGQFNLRSGASTRHRIIRTLSSGTQVDVLSKDEDSGYSRVRTEDGKTGYILTRHLQDSPAARSQLAEMRAQLEELQQEPDQLAARLSKINTEHELLKEQYATVASRNVELEEALAEFEHTSANIVHINEERNRLQRDVAKLTRTVGDLEQENLAIRSGDNWQWFLTGAGVAGAGLLVGLVLGGSGLGGRRRSGSRDLF